MYGLGFRAGVHISIFMDASRMFWGYLSETARFRTMHTAASITGLNIPGGTRVRVLRNTH